MSKSIQSMFLEAMKNAPQMCLEQLLRDKLKNSGVSSYRSGAKALANHIFHHKTEEFHWIDPTDNMDLDVAIAFTEDDGKKLEELFDSLVGELPEISEKLLREMSKKILRNYQRDWFKFRRLEERSLRGFQINLENRWGNAFDGLRLLVDLCSDEGEKFYKRLQSTKAKATPFAKIALSRLHVRSCQVAREILVLLENGFADGAMARWRTLHEIEVTMAIVRDGGNRLAERYLDHEIVEAKRASDLYVKDHEVLGLRKPRIADTLKKQREFQSIKAKYGPNFVKPFGWASEYLENSNPKFSHLEERAGSQELRSYYKLASYNVHAHSRSLNNRIGCLDKSLIVSGSTNA